MKKRSILLLIMSLFITLFIVACSNEAGNESEKPDTSTEDQGNEQQEETPQEEEEPEEVVLKFLYELGEPEFNTLFKEPVEAEFPHITLEFVDSTNLDDVFATGLQPDIYFNLNPVFLLSKWKEYELTMDLTDLIEKHGFDLSRIEPSLIDEHRAFSDGNLYSLPIDRGMSVLHYNKDIFDLFGVDYPTDNMTWEEVIDLARQVTGERDGTHYYGLQMDFPQIMLEQMGTPFADPETGEPTYTSEKYGPDFVKNLQLLQEIFTIPGNLPEDDPTGFVFDQGRKFISNQNVAMLPLWQLIGWYSGSENFNFDVVTIPVLEDLPGVSRASRAFSLGVASTSQHPDEAFKVIEFILSDEIQKWRAEQFGYGSVLADPSANENLFKKLIEDRPWIADLNFEALTKHAPATTDVNFHVYDQVAAQAYQPMVEKLILGNDINTILREAQEEAEILIRQEREKE